MNEPRDYADLNSGELDALRYVDTSPVPAASPMARERARNAFLTGSPERRGRTVPLRFLVPLAAAASLLILSWFGAQPTMEWTVTDADNATLERANLPDDRVIGKGDTFKHGTVITEPDGSLDVTLGDRLRVAVSPGARVELPPAPGRWFGNPRSLRVSEGDMFATTGGSPLGFELVVETDETLTRIVGTTFAVRCNEQGTCVCLYEGRLAVEAADGVHVVDAPMSRVQFFEDGRLPMVEELTLAEREMLRNLYEGS